MLILIVDICLSLCWPAGCIRLTDRPTTPPATVLPAGGGWCWLVSPHWRQSPLYCRISRTYTTHLSFRISSNIHDKNIPGKVKYNSITGGWTGLTVNYEDVRWDVRCEGFPGSQWALTACKVGATEDWGGSGGWLLDCYTVTQLPPASPLPTSTAILERNNNCSCSAGGAAREEIIKWKSWLICWIEKCVLCPVH